MIHRGDTGPLYIGRSGDGWYVVPLTSDSGWRTRRHDHAYIYALYAAGARLKPSAYKKVREEVLRRARDKGYSIPDDAQLLADAANLLARIRDGVEVHPVSDTAGPKSVYFIDYLYKIAAIHADNVGKKFNIDLARAEEIPARDITVKIERGYGDYETLKFNDYRVRIKDTGYVVTPFGKYDIDFAKIVKKLGKRGAKLLRHNNILIGLAGGVAILAAPY